MRKRKKKTNKKLILPILIISLFMCIGYAEITNTNISITGILDAIAQKEVFISDVTTTDKSSIINGYTGTVLDTKTVLGSSTTSVVSYNITLYNNSEKDYIFIGVLKDDDLYSNTNITYTLSGLKEYETTIYPQSSLTFTITFKYVGTNVSNNILESKLNFRFREKPEISLSSEGDKYKLENVYPGYTPGEYKFTVTDKNEATGKKNGVSMKYTFEVTIDEPLKAEIYDGTKLVTGSVDLKGEKEYTLKIIWDESKNSLDYANKEYTGNVKLKAVPTNTDYTDYNITKEFDINIKTSAFYFNAELGAESVKLEGEEVGVGITVKNNNSNTAYNNFDTSYEMYFENASKFNLRLEDTNNGVISSGANTNNVTAKISLKEGQTLETAETANIIIKATKPYEKEISKTITIEPVERISIKDLQAGTYVNYVDNNGNKIPCVILYDTAYNAAKGTDYGIQVITASPVKDVTIGSSNFEEARIEYNSAIQTLNNEAMTYLNTNYATDARCVGTNPADKNAEGEEKEYESYGIFKSGDENYVIDATRISELGITYLSDAWFASRRVTEKRGEPVFSIRYGYSLTRKICYVELGDLNCTIVTADLYPVFTLKSNIYTNGGAGTAESPYNLVVGEEPLNFSGKGTEASPYLISTLEDLKYLAEKVNSGKKFTGTYFEVTADINLNNQEWEPIGNSEDNYFDGIIDFAGHSVGGLVITEAREYSGLFGNTGTNCEIKNIDIDIQDWGVLIQNGTYVGEVVAYNRGKIIAANIRMNMINGEKYVGGIAGYNEGIIENSVIRCESIYSNMEIEGYTGGIAGYNKGIIKDSVETWINEIGAKRYLGGIVGYNEGTIINTTSESVWPREGNNNINFKLNGQRIISIRGITWEEWIGYKFWMFSDDEYSVERRLYSRRLWLRIYMFSRWNISNNR